MDLEYNIIPRPKNELTPTLIGGMLDSIRPLWKSKDLIKRVDRLLLVDPSSACQRLLNAAIFDLREKVITVGIDIAKEVAKNYRLPSIEKDDDILEHYSTSNLIELVYRMGILKRSEWRRIQRCYEIRKDLEHEDNEYEAVLEDCFYIFKSTIEIVLSQDPIELLKITDVKQIVLEPTKLTTTTQELLENYGHAPALRQKEIITFLLSTARDDMQPDLVRENCFQMLRHFKDLTQNTVIIEAAKFLEEKLGKAPIDLLTAKLGHACGATAYFKKIKVSDFYSALYIELKSSSGSWDSQAKIVAKFEDIGAYNYCPAEMIPKFTKYLVIYYIGKPGGYGDYGRNRAVFYSNSAAPIISRIISNSSVKLYDIIDNLRTFDPVKSEIADRNIIKRFEDLLDLVKN